MRKYVIAAALSLVSMFVLTIIDQELFELSDFLIGGLTMNVYWWYIYSKIIFKD